jgi:hypothetical protein
MTSNLSASVGRWERRVRNCPADVEVVQRLLETAAHAFRASQLDPKGVDGKIAHPPATSNTVESSTVRHLVPLLPWLRPGSTHYDLCVIHK